jgi:predicted adenylyl cyclase CyaB
VVTYTRGVISLTTIAMAQFEIEIKSLLGEKSAAEALIAQLCERDPACVKTAENSQLNHYFEGGNIDALYQKVEHLFGVDQQEKLQHIIEKGTSFSVRTREKDSEVLLVVKASVDQGTSANTVSRLEFEEPVAISLDALDRLIENAGYRYQAKWSRAREEYAYKGLNVCIDKNAGYGYLAEFEKVTDAEHTIAEVRAEIESIMAELGVAELPQDRLARMFDFYNNNWAEYYGTEKTFLIE